MKWLGAGTRTVTAMIVAFIVVGGFTVALLSSASSQPSYAPDVILGSYTGAAFSAGRAGSLVSLQSGIPGFAINSPTGGVANYVSTVTASTTTEAQPPQTTVVGVTSPPAEQQNQNSLKSGNATRSIEFFSNVTMESQSPQSLASRIIGLAYSVGGYVAYQSTQESYAYVIIRVPADTYEQVLSQVESLGNVTSLTSNSNDVTVKYTNLNATLTSLVAEQQALLRLINATTKVNDTLAIEDRLQGVDAQINFVESEILQTQRLVAYSTITVSISREAQVKPLAMKLSATPRSGASPLAVTFNAVVSGGRTPYVVDYNFGDGSSEQGQIVIHQYYQSGAYNVTVSATDSAGNVTMASTVVHVTSAPSPIGFGNFPSSIADLFVRVLEGMATVAVVVLPVAGVLAAVIVPIRRRGRSRKEVR